MKLKSAYVSTRPAAYAYRYLKYNVGLVTLRNVAGVHFLWKKFVSVLLCVGRVCWFRFVPESLRKPQQKPLMRLNFLFSTLKFSAESQKKLKAKCISGVVFAFKTFWSLLFLIKRRKPTLQKPSCVIATFSRGRLF